MKFVLAECENPILYSPNDLLTWQNQIHDVWTSNINSVYTYQYNSSGYPISAAVKTTLNTGQVIDGNLSYKYQ